MEARFAQRAFNNFFSALILLLLVIVSLFGVLMLAHALIPIYQSWEARDWPQAEARLEQVRVVQPTGAWRTDSAAITVSYRYQVAGREWQAHRHGPASRRHAYSWHDAQARVSRLLELQREYETVPVWYDPDNAERAFLDRSPPSDEIIADDLIWGVSCLLMGGLLSVMFVHFLISERRKRRALANRTDVLAARPGMTSRPEPWAYQWPRLVGTLSFLPVLFWLLLLVLGLFAPVPFDEFVRLDRDAPWSFMLAAFLAVFLMVAGVVWWQRASYEKRRFEDNDGRIGDVVLRLEPYTPRLGGLIGGRFRLELPVTAELCFLTASLRATSWLKQGNRSDRQEVFAQQQALLCNELELRDRGRVIECRFAFDTSDHAIPEAHLRQGVLGWQLTIKGHAGPHEFDRQWALPVERPRDGV